MKWVLLAFLGVAAASQVQTWLPDQEHIFHYTTTVHSGIPELKAQYSGLRISTVVRAQRFTDHVRIQFEDAKFKNYDNVVFADHERSLKMHRRHEGLEDVEDIPTDIKVHLESPFKVVMNQEGLVEKIQCEADEPVYITNIKKAAVSHLLTLSMSKMTKEESERQDRTVQEFKPAFKRMETSISGECETYYTIAALPAAVARDLEQSEQIPGSQVCEGKPYYEVLKTKDVKSCKERPIYMHVYGASSVSDGSMGSTAPFVGESATTRSIICGSPEEFHVRQTTMDHRFIVSPSGKFESKEVMEVISWTALSFHAIVNKTAEISEITAPKALGSLIYEFPSEDAFSSKISTKSLISEETRRSEEGEEYFKSQVAKPDMVSAPQALFPHQVMSAEETKHQLVLAFQKLMEMGHASPESAHSHEDVTGTATMVTEVMARLSLAEIKGLWASIEQELPEDIKEQGHQTFLDLLSICATNPCVKYIIEAVKEDKLAGESGAWILSNAIRSVKTPTEELLKELTDLLKTMEHNSKLHSAIVLSLSNLVFKACIDPTSSVYDYPVKTYGRFCDEKSTVITRELIPYLSARLFAAQESNIHLILTAINALGNIGHDGASIHLLKVIEGTPSSSPYIRSVAVYQLIKAASANPTLYRPVILSLINNYAESDEVRMAAITALPYTRPDSAVFNKLAIRTWWDPSHQVVSYIHTMLRSMAELPNHTNMYAGYPYSVQEHACIALRLAKPEETGLLQTSNNVMIVQFLDTLKASVGLKFQRILSEDSASFPTEVFIKKSVTSRTTNIESSKNSLHLQGGPYLINKMYNVYNEMLTGAEREKLVQNRMYVKNIVPVEDRLLIRPEFTLTASMNGLQRIFAINEQMVEQFIEEITMESIKAMKSHHRISKNFMKIIDVSGNTAIIPTECGHPVYISHRTPLVVSAKTSVNMNVKAMDKGEATVTIKPVANYKQISHAGVFCPITRKFLGTGVDTALHLALPLEVAVAMQEGQYTVTIKTPKDQESQLAKPIVEFMVKPFTTAFDLNTRTIDYISKSVNTKVIKTSVPLKERELDIGRPFGLSLKMKVETEHKYFDVAQFLAELMEHQPLTLLSLPLPLKTVRDHSVSLIYDPKLSTTKEASVVLSYGYGKKESRSVEPEVFTSCSAKVPHSIFEMCWGEAREWMQKEKAERREERNTVCVRKHQAICQKRLEEKIQYGEEETVAREQAEKCRRAAVTKCPQEFEMNLILETIERQEVCERKAIAELEKKKCRSQMEKESRPTHEVESYCSKKSFQSTMKHSSSSSNIKSSKKVLKSIGHPARAVALNLLLALHREDYTVDQKIEAQITLAQKTPVQGQKGEVKIEASVKTHLSPNPLEVEIDVEHDIRTPVYRWDKDAMIEEDLTSRVTIKSQIGFKDGRKESVEAQLKLARTEAMKNYAKASVAWKKCATNLSTNLKLSESCKEARQLAASMNNIELSLALPKVVRRSPYLDALFRMAKVYYLPYLTEEVTGYNRKSENHEHFKLDLDISPCGRFLTSKIDNDRLKTVFKNIRLHPITKDLLPINVDDTVVHQLLDKVTAKDAPSTCSVEGNRVSTFDKVVYNYELNNCEHVIFKDCSAVPKVMVSVKKTHGRHFVKAIIDNNKYELELVQLMRGSRSTPNKLKVNGQVVEPIVNQASSITYFEDKANSITLSQDGVFEIFSLKYGITVLADQLSAQVKTYQWALRALACGLCGDLNDETTADVRSAKNCVMSSPKLAAYSYMVQDQTCAGIPQQDREVYQREELECVKKVVEPTKLMEVFSYVQRTIKKMQSMKHYIIDAGQLICFSKKQVKVCSRESQPAEVVRKEMSFFCLPKDKEGEVIKKLAERGEKIPHAEKYPTKKTQMVYEPKQC